MKMELLLYTISQKLLSHILVYNYYCLRRLGLKNNDLSFDLEAATKFTDFNSNDLGRYHSSMHVRHCKSTTCAICIKEKGVFFVKSRKDEFVPSAEAAGGSVS